MAELGRLLEHSSRDDSEGNADPKLLRYNIAIYPSEDIIMIVKDSELLEHRASNMDRRLKDFVLGQTKAFTYGLTSVSSIRGGMADKLTAQVTRAEYTMKGQNPRARNMLEKMIQGDQE